VNALKEAASDEALKMLLDEIDPLAFPLLRWVIQSNRTQLSLVHPSKQINEMKTPYQFTMLNSFPEHERKFQEWVTRSRREKGGNGVFNAFHGSPVGNWHSILRTGLRSGHVPGIYMAGQATISHGYMAVGQSQAVGWKNSMFEHNNNISAIALLEVADMRHNNKFVTGGVVPEGVNVALANELVCTRFLFFYPKGPTFTNAALNNRWGLANPFAVAGNLIASKLRIDKNMWKAVRRSADNNDDNNNNNNNDDAE